MQTMTFITVDKAITISRRNYPDIRSLQKLTLFRTLLLLMVVVSLGIFLGAKQVLADGTRAGKTKVSLKRLGKPCFEPVDFHLFSESIDDLEGLLNGNKGILPEPAHRLHPELFVGPGEPHDPPYNEELQDGLDRLGIPDQQRFTPEDFSLPNAIFFAFMVIAKKRGDCPQGSSPDFAQGPIIPNVLFPTDPQPDRVLLSRTTFFRNGKVFDPNFVQNDPQRLDKVEPSFDVDGHSHIPIFLITAAEFGPGGEVKGYYRIHSVLLDQAGNGWDITTWFRIR